MIINEMAKRHFILCKKEKPTYVRSWKQASLVDYYLESRNEIRYNNFIYILKLVLLTFLFAVHMDIFNNNKICLLTLLTSLRHSEKIVNQTVKKLN